MAFVRNPLTATPIMTSNTHPSGVASCSSYYSVAFDAYCAFNNLITNPDCWATSSGETTGTLVFDFGDPVVINGYDIYSQSLVPLSAPKNWTIKAWNGSSFITIDSRTGITGWEDYTVKHFSFANNVPYSKYSINITMNNGHSYVAIGELQLLRGESKTRPQII